MKKTIHFGNIVSTQNLKNLISEKLSELEPLASQAQEAEVWIQNDGTIEGRGAPQFSTRMRLRRPRKKDFYVAKKSENFFESLHKATRSMAQALRKSNSAPQWKQQRRRKDTL